MDPHAPIRLQLLGPPVVTGRDGSPISGRAAQRHRLALLAVLARAPASGVSRNVLMTLLWPESDQEQARNLLKVSLYVLRQTLGDAAIESVGDNVRLAPRALEVDTVELEAAVARGDLTAAVALHRGPFLDGFSLKDSPEFDHWVDRERARLSDLYAKALETLAEDAEQRRDRRAATEWWKARAAQDPLDSRVALRLMGALVAAGNRAGAIRHATIHAQLLEQELGIESKEVMAQQERLRSEPDVAPEEPLPPTAPPPVEPGVGAAPSHAVAVASAPTVRRRSWAVALFGVAFAATAIALLIDTRQTPEEIAQAVARQLGSTTAPPTRPPTVNVVAWDLYTQGSRQEVQRDDSAALVALEQLRRAVEIDPSFAAAHAGLARLYLRSPGGAGTSRTDRHRLAVQHATEATALDDGLGEAHATLGIALMNLYDHEAAEAHLLRAVEIEPGTAVYREWLAQLYTGMGRFRDALVQAQLALAADPLSPTARAEVARALMVNGRCDEALAQLAPLADLRPALLRAEQIAAQCYAEKGLWDAAVAEASRSIASSGARGKGALAYFLARAGRADEANALLEELIQGARSDSGDAFFVATAYTGLARTDEAFDWLVRAIADYSLNFEVMEPKFAELHDDPRFARIRALFGQEGV
jgi:DNA-binding SARP family transcriptional activator